MNTSNQILVVDVNVIIHLQKVGLLDDLVSDKRIRIVDLVLYQEYLCKRNDASDKVEKIRQVNLNEKQMFEAQCLYESNPRNSVFDYYSYIAARDNNYELLTGDWKLKKKLDDVSVHGSIWYVQDLYNNKIISREKLKNIYETWLNDPLVYIKSEILIDLIMDLDVN